MIRFNNDKMCITIHGWQYEMRIIQGYLEPYDTIQCLEIIMVSSFFWFVFCFLTKNRGK